jgi:hypothetical protein
MIFKVAERKQCTTVGDKNEKLIKKRVKKRENQERNELK